ncbi:MAG: dihydropteroate synthase [Acidobacteria bacterium]|nr:MAG: dihydropteroate synthase [Acidobacteriota bacterium]
MGIVNVTPDSFSDGGRFVDPADAADRAEQLVAEGAEIVDVGGESTRPGARPVTVDEELARVLPAIEAIRARLPDARLSIDTRHAEVARRALAAGADLVNDVSALRDPEMAGVVAAAGCPVVLMHMRGEPGTMQRDTRYVDLLGEILDFLGERVDAARAAGIAGDRILVDPGLGFGKSPEANEQLLRQSGAFHSLGCPVLIGASRKSFIGRRTGIEPPEARLAGSLAAAVIAATEGVELVRVHDVAPTRAALAVADAVREAGAPRR